MKPIKSISALMVLAAFLAVAALQPDSFAKTKPTGRTQHVSLQVSDITCPYCSKSLESCLGKVKGAENVKADYNTGYASLDVPMTTQVTKEQLQKAVADAGFILKEVKFIAKPDKNTNLRLQSQQKPLSTKISVEIDRN